MITNKEPMMGGIYGTRAMRQTMNSQSQLSGGYGNSYGNQSMNGGGDRLTYAALGDKKHINQDRLWQVYSDQALNSGRLAMQDAIGQNTANTGGYGNSYATQAASSAYMDYLSQLNEKWEPLYREKTGGTAKKTEKPKEVQIPVPKQPVDTVSLDWYTRVQPVLEKETKKTILDEGKKLTRDEMIELLRKK